MTKNVLFSPYHLLANRVLRQNPGLPSLYLANPPLNTYLHLPLPLVGQHDNHFVDIGVELLSF